MDSKPYQILPPPEFLQNEVACFVVTEINSSEEVSFQVFPNALPGLVIQNHEDGSSIANIAIQSGRESIPPPFFVYGAGTEPSVMHFKKGHYATIQVILRPHALNTLFGVNALDLVHETPPLSEFAKDSLHEQLFMAANTREQVAILTHFLASRLALSTTRDHLVEESLRLIECQINAISVRALLEELDISERQFERRFSRAVGVSPLTYIRVRRFNKALQLIRSGKYATLTDVAYALNFHDQSHFIREFKSFTGNTPMSVAQRADELIHHQVGYFHR